MSNPTLLRGDRVREGFAKKAAASKGTDSCRGNWQERYFVLVRHELHYYKNKDDSKPKGSIDMRAARVDAATEALTGKPFCVRIAEAKQIFIYVQFHSEEDREKWVQVLRIAAGYKEGISLQGEGANKEANNDIPFWTERNETLCTFPLLLLASADAEHPERITLSLTELHGGAIRLVKGDQLYSSYRGTQISRVEYSVKPELRLVDTAGVHELHTCTIYIKLNPQSTSLIKYVFFAGAIEDAKLLTYYLRAMARGELATIKKICAAPIVQSGYLEFGDTSISSGWLRRFCCLTDRRLIFYKTASSNVPTWVVSITNAIYREGKVGIRIGASLETVIVKFETEPMRDIWLTNLISSSADIGNKMAVELKDGEEHEAKEQKAKLDEERKKLLIAEQLRKTEQEKVEKKPKPEVEEKAPPVPVDVKITPNRVDEFGAGEPAYIAAIGSGECGQLGNRSNNSSLSPVLVDSLVGKNVRYVSAGKEFSGCITESGHVFMWGTGKSFQLGLGERMLESKAPCLNTSLLRFGGMAMLSCGVEHTIALSFTGQAFAWGAGASGALGLGKDLRNVPYPQQVDAFKRRPVCFISAGAKHSAFITAESNELFLTGTNNNGCLGLNNCILGQVTCDPQPCSALNQIGKVTSVACSNNFTCAIIAPGRLFNWGANACGQLGVRDKTDRPTPTLVQFPGKTQPVVKQIGAGLQHCIALVSNDDQNMIYTWGAPICNGFRELQTIPTLVQALSHNAETSVHPVFVASSHSASHSLCVNSSNQMFAFGLNEFGELGNGQAGVQALVKVKLNPLCKINQAVCGSGFTMAMCKGTAPEILSSSKQHLGIASPVSGPNHLQGQIPGDLTLHNSSEAGPSLDEAAMQIAKLLQLEVDNKTKISGGPKTVVQPGQIEIDGKWNEELTQQQQQQQQQQQAASAVPLPLVATATVKPPLPAGWKKVKDEKSGRHYYYHSVTKEVTWKRPQE